MAVNYVNLQLKFGRKLRIYNLQKSIMELDPGTH